MSALDAGGWDVFGLSQVRFETILLVLVRIFAMLSLVPIFSGTQVPTLVRTGLALLLAYVVGRTIPAMPHALGLGELALGIVAQVGIGMIFGFIAFLVFTGVQFAGEIIDTQIGFAVVNIINPITQQNITVIGELQLALATLIYLGVDAHHRLLEGIAGSFALVPLPFAAPQLVLAGNISGFLTTALGLVFQIAAPVAISLFVVNVSLALMARVAPQLNVFVVGFPLQITVGLLMLILSLPLLGIVLPEVFAQNDVQIDAALRQMTAPTASPTPAVR